MEPITLQLPLTLRQRLSQLATIEGVSLREYILYTLTRQAVTPTESPIYVLTEQERAVEAQQLQTIVDNLNPADNDYFEAVMAEREQADPDPDYPAALHTAMIAKIDAISVR